jgi:hypothetical protein
MQSFAVPSVHRLMRVMFVVMVALALSLPAIGAYASEAGTVVLAAEVGDVGPVPADRLAEDNPARELVGYDDRDIPFTWGAAWILAFTGFLGLGTAALLYRMKVVRPQRQA